MKRTILFFIFILAGTTGFAERIVLDNQTTNPTKNQQSKVAIQWATSARNAKENNNMVRQGLKLNPDTLRVLTKLGKINLDLPQNAEYFRVLVWSKGTGDPDFLTNWVTLVPNKTYTLNEDHLVPLALMAGTGC